MTRDDSIEQLKWRLLGDATTDQYSLHEVMEYRDSTRTKSDELVFAALQELLDDGLIEFFYEDAQPPEAEDSTPDPHGIWTTLQRGRTPNTPRRTRLGSQEARQALLDRNPSSGLSAVGAALWFSATERGEDTYRTLSPDQVAAAFDDLEPPQGSDSS